MNLQGWIWAGLLAAAPAAQAISRVGNAHIGDPALGFLVEASENFALKTFEDVETEAVLQSKRQVIRFRDDRPQRGYVRVEIHHFSTAFASQVESSREEIPEWLGEWEDVEWTKVATEDGCIDAYRMTNDTAHAAILMWGVGKGLLLVGERSNYSAEEIGRWIQTLELEEGACAWPTP